MAGRPRTRRNPEEHPRILIDAATRLFAEHTYGGVTIQAIAAEAGVSLTAFYKVFGERERCLQECFLDVKQRLVESLLAVPIEGQTPRDRTRELFDALFQFLDTHPVHARLLLPEVVGGSQATVEELWKMLDELGEFINDLNVVGVAEGVAQPMQVPDVGLFVAGGVYAVCTKHIRAGTVSELRADSRSLDATVSAFFAATQELTE